MSRTALIAVSLLTASLSALAGTARAAGPGASSTIVAPAPPPTSPAPPAAPSASPAVPLPASSLAAQSLTRIYRGEDGGALYLRQRGNTVYGFGEHPGARYAYVLTATVTGDRLTGSWWDVPKGTRFQRGSLSLRFSQQGARLVRSGGADLGPDTFTAVSPSGIPWPNRQAAGFQATTTSDLDGVFAGEDASRHYAREADGQVAWVAERASQPGEQPGWVSVFVGRRKAGGGFAGSWVDVPKGLELRQGTFGAALLGGRRELALAQTGAKRTKRLSPDYALDWNRFEKKIDDTLSANGVTGYAYAIARHGALLRSGAGGFRLNGADGGEKPFTTDTMSQAASTSKTLTAVALVKALHERGISLDTPIRRYLPTCWKRGPLVDGYTFRQLLDHTSALPRTVACPNDSTGRADPYECLRKAVEQGQDGIVLAPVYNNMAYSLMRILVPAVVDLDGTQGTFEAWKCANTKGILNRKISEKFNRYLFREVLDPVGVRASFYPSSDLVAYTYDKDDPAKPGRGPEPDFSTRAGAGWLSISAREMVRFLGALEAGEIVPTGVVAEMKRGNLGFDGSPAGRTGGYATKNGGCPTRDGISCGAQLMLYPGGVQAYVIVNSRGGGNLAQLLRVAFDEALR
jgi:CubicO group peptidase (beta-lactamase class C family)